MAEVPTKLPMLFGFDPKVPETGVPGPGGIADPVVNVVITEFAIDTLPVHVPGMASG
jgi:hypothetical protein